MHHLLVDSIIDLPLSTPTYILLQLIVEYFTILTQFPIFLWPFISINLLLWFGKYIVARARSIFLLSIFEQYLYFIVGLYSTNKTSLLHCWYYAIYLYIQIHIRMSYESSPRMWSCHVMSTNDIIIILYYWYPLMTKIQKPTTTWIDTIIRLYYATDR